MNLSRLGRSMVLLVMGLVPLGACGGNPSSPADLGHVDRHDAAGPADLPPDDLPGPDATPDVGPPGDAPDLADGGGDLTSPDGTDGPDGGAVIISGQERGSFQGETRLAVAPDGTVAAAWISSTGSDAIIQYAFSPDSGQTWEAVSAVETHTGEFASDPDITVDVSGNFYLSWLSLKLNSTFTPAHLYVARAPAGVRAFMPGVEATDPTLQTTYDHPKITVTRDGTLVAVVLRLDAGDNGRGVVATSTDGMNWTQSTFLPADPTRFSNFFYPCAPRLAGDRLFMTYFNEDGAGTEIELIFSDDGGATWSVPLTVSNPSDDPVAATDPVCVTEGNDVWISYGVSPIPPDTTQENLALVTGIRVAHSPDRGASIDMRIDATDTAAGAYSVLPQLALEEDSGALDLVYYAGQMSPDAAGSFRHARATAGSFAPSAAIVAPLTFTTDRASPMWLGDYVGLTYRSGAVFTAFADNASGTSRIGFARLPVPAP
jgi:hypothetical protein